MKLRLKTSQAQPAPSRGRKPKLLGGSARVNFWIETDILEDGAELIEEWTRLKLSPRLNRSDLARIGFSLAVKDLRKQLTVAKQGKLHAKRR